MRFNILLISDQKQFVDKISDGIVCNEPFEVFFCDNFSYIKNLIKELVFDILVYFPEKQNEDLSKILNFILQHENFSEKPILVATRNSSIKRDQLIPGNIVIVPDLNPLPFIISRINFHVELLKKEYQLLKENRYNDESTNQMQYLVQFLQTLINTIPNPIFYKDSHGNYMGLNDAFEKFVNKGREEIFGKTVFDLWSKEQASILAEADEQLLNTNELQEYETTLERGDGKRRDVLLYRTTFHDENHANKGIIGTIVDITERKLLEKELLALTQTLEKKVIQETEKRTKSEIQFQHIFQRSPIGVFLLNKEREVIEANPEILRLLKTERENIINVNLKHILHPDCYNFDKILQNSFQNGKKDSIKKDIKLLTSDHHTIWVTISSSGIYDKSKNLDHIIMAIVDITEKKEMTEKIIQNEDRLRSIMDSVNDAILLLDENGHISHWNKSFEDMFGFSEIEITSIFFDDLLVHSRYVDDRSKSISEEIYSELIAENQSLLLMARRKNKSTFPIDLSITNVFLEGTSKSIAVIRDITFQIESEQKQKRQEQLLIQQSKLAAMGEMIAMIAHQWRQPLNIIALLIQDLKDSYKFGEIDLPYIDDLVEKAMKNIAFMSNTIDNFRDFFKIDRNKEYFNVYDSVMEIIRLILPQFNNNYTNIFFRINKKDKYTLMTNDSNLKTSSNVLYEQLQTLGYSNEFKQVIMNLLINAKDAILLKKENIHDFEGHIYIDLTLEQNQIIIKVEDNGGGIPEKIIDKIFDPYFTTKGEHSGTGIGLYMSKTIIENKMNGKLNASNTEKGALFTIQVFKTKNSIEK